ncbi:MAG TPA: endonuclease/exonuclease/phosphatase family protein [Candidatus Nitrosocosmicus sp.]|nr:endonuclease/exonuclease/phosphatase family protein [Candidatus Nitrosocosmicus sp.]
MKKLLLLVAAAIIIMIYADIRYASVPVALEKKLIIEEQEKSEVQEMPVLKVMTYNIHRGVNRNNELDLDGIAKVIIGSGADIIALQEVERYSVRTKFQDQIGYLAEKLSMFHAYGKSVNILNGQYGNAILSRYPIEEYEVKELPSKGEKRTLLKARLDIGGKSLPVYSTHLGLNKSERDMQLEEIMGIIRNEKSFILAGDFNASVDKLGAVSEICKDSASFGNGSSAATFEGEGISERIDYIFTSENFEIKEYAVPASQASDHYPVVSVLEYAD